MRWRSYFDEEQMLIINSERLFSDFFAVWSEILAYLEVASWQPKAITPQNSGNYVPMKEQTREKLKLYFTPHNEKLFDFLQNDFGWN